MLRGKLPHQEKYKSDNAQDEQQEDEVRTKPVLLLAFVQHHLQAADAQRKITNAPVINPTLAAFDVWRILNEQHHHGHGRYADWNVDIEQPSPGVAVSNPAAQNRAKHGRNHNTQRPECHGLAPLLRWERLHEDRLRQRLQTSACRTLENAENN